MKIFRFFPVTLFAILHATQVFAYSGGNGTAAKPYLVSSKADMIQLATNVNGGETYSGKYFSLTRDLTASGDIISTIIGENSSKYFGGIFDGNGYTIAVDKYGIFGIIKDATIKNLNVVGVITSFSVNISSLSSFPPFYYAHYAGGICAKAISSSISNCSCSASISISTDYRHELTGDLSASFTHEAYIGGICGHTSENTIITTSYNAGTISTLVYAKGDTRGPFSPGGPIISYTVYPYSLVGGICGYISATDSIVDCYNTGALNSTSNYYTGNCYAYAGGICGYTNNLSAGVIKNSYNIGHVSAKAQFTTNSYSGGICGRFGNIQNCFVANCEIKNVSDPTMVKIGRITGDSTSAINSNCYAEGSSVSLNGDAISNLNANSKNGKDAMLTDFQNEAWMTTNLRWNLYDVWIIKPGNLPVLRSSLKYEINATASPIAGGSVTGSKAYRADSTVSLQANANPYYSFDGWEENLNIVSTSQNYSFIATEDRTLFAKFTPETYNITYNYGGLTGVTNTNPTNYTYSTGITSFATPSKAGYKFGGWYSDIALTIPITSISSTNTGAKTLYAKFSFEIYPITYNYGGLTGVTNSNQASYTYGTGITSFTPASKTGYKFDGWFSDILYISQVVSISSTEIDAKTLYAKLSPATYTITYNYKGLTGVTNNNQTNYTYGIGITSFTTPSKTGYIFDGWYSDALFTTPITSISAADVNNKIIYAKLTPEIYNITYNFGGLSGVFNNNPTTYSYETGLSSLLTPFRIGYNFEGWYSDALFATPIAGISSTEIGAKTLYAKFTLATYTITYNYNGLTGVTNNNQTNYTYGTGFTLTDPSKTGYTFEGWYNDTSFTTLITNISSTDADNKTIYAKLTPEIYNITYNYGGLTGVTNNNPTSYTYGTGIISLITPSRTGYNFEGWYSDALFSTPIASISSTEIGAKTLYAKFTLATYTITYDYNGLTGVTSTNPMNYTYGTGFTFTVPSKTGYTFEGWYRDASFTTLTTSISSTDMGNKTIYAKFIPEVYNITYNYGGLTGVTNNNPTSYTYGTGIISFTAPFKIDYTFKGWYSDSLFTTPITSIGNLETGIKILYAKFIIKTSIQDSKINVELSVYPSPANQHITIAGAEGTNLIIYNITGHIVYKKNSISNEETIDVSTLVKGVYTVHVNAIKRKIIIS